MFVNNIHKIKILFVIPTLNGGGAERVFVNYIRSLNIERFDISLLLINKTGEFLKFIPKYVKIVDIGKNKTRYGFFKLLKSVKNINPELIVSTTNRMNILILIVSLFVTNIIKICLYEPSMPRAQFGEKYLPRYYLLLMKILYRHSDYIIAQTNEMKNEISDYYFVKKEKIFVTSNPMDTKLIDEQASQYENPYDKSNINVVASGRISEEKGFDFLLRSFVKVVEKNKKFKLYILGNVSNKSYLNKLQNIIKKCDLTNHVQFVGFKLNPFPYYKHADLFVLSSKWEGLPNVVLEALYLQTPVVVTDCIPYFKKLICEGKNGYIVKFGDKQDLAEKIQRYLDLSVNRNSLELPNYDKIFWKMVHA